MVTFIEMSAPTGDHTRATSFVLNFVITCAYNEGEDEAVAGKEGR